MVIADFDDARRGLHGLPTVYEAIHGLQLQVAGVYAEARMMRSDFPEAAVCYAQRAAALSLAARVLAGIETAGDISAAAASATYRPATHADALAAHLEARDRIIDELCEGVEISDRGVDYWLAKLRR